MLKSERLLIQDLSDKRCALIKEHEDSWDNKLKVYKKLESPEIDVLADNLLALIRQHRNLLEVDFIIEELTKLGQAPNILYDDNGHFAITADGYSSVSTEPRDASIFSFVRKSQWKRTIREALENFMFESAEDYDYPETITLTKEEVQNFYNDVAGEQVGWSDTSYRIAEFIGIDPTQGT